MNNEKLAQYKQNLKSPYTGMTEELARKIDGIEVKKEPNLDLNNDGKVDKADLSIAGKVMRKVRKVN